MKILCLDGGGIRGVFTIAILNAIEQEYKKPISHYFDMVSGTSTGSIIAASVVLETKMDSLLKLYLRYGSRIFNPQTRIGYLKTVYNDRYLRRLLKKAFGTVKLSDVSMPLIIPAVDITHNKPYVHRSRKQERKDDSTIQLWDAVLSSCSAPIYFPPNNVENKFLSIDGGLWANNPSMVCLTEALHYYDTPLGSLHILSLGTGKQVINFSFKKGLSWGIQQWLPFDFPAFKVTPKLLDLALDLSSEAVSYHCDLLLNQNYIRINKNLGKEMPFDDLTFVETLIDLGKEVFLEKKQEIEDFLNI